MKIMEVGLRDGLQALNKIISIKDKLYFINGFIDAGIKNIQVTSFVNPQIVPQMLNAEKLVKELPIINGVEYSALVFNEKGVERAVQSGISKVETSISVSSEYNQKNLKMDKAKSLRNLKRVTRLSLKNKLKIRAGLQCVWGCPYEGRLNEGSIINSVSDILDMGIKRISLCDTSGMATPDTVFSLLNNITKLFPGIKLCMHFHNTYGLGLLNLSQAIQFDIDEVDTSLGGIGGSPFMKQSKGNIATEDTVNMLNNMGYNTGIDIKKISRLSKKLEKIIGKTYFSGHLYKIIN